MSVPGAEVQRMRCTNADRRTPLDLRYDVIGAHGLGVHRGALFHTLFARVRPYPWGAATAWRRRARR